ncbi:MAG: hypothetical protein HY072_01520 [Deltaproteobacteria bacterium]|nr:hypothetical protein [Deltaproteobacteria bacterium]
MIDVEPNSRIALQIKLSADVMAQEMIVRSWPKNQAQWIAQQGCDNKTDLFVPLPSLSYGIRQFDHLGPKPLKWLPGIPKSLEIQLSNRPRHAKIEIFGGVHDYSSWKARWAPTKNDIFSSLVGGTHVQKNIDLSKPERTGFD